MRTDEDVMELRRRIQQKRDARRFIELSPREIIEEADWIRHEVKRLQRESTDALDTFDAVFANSPAEERVHVPRSFP